MLPSSSQPSTSTADSASDAKSSSYQVLNISNVNAQQEVVLNDEKLLGLIQLYPFLYNPHVQPFRDPDFDSYAWEKITKGFNRSYECLERNVWYTTAELQARWSVLQPIVRSLSKISNIKTLPDSLRQTVIKMSVPMEAQAANESFKKPLTLAQKTILDNIEMVKKLPLEHKRRLEAEMMELILNCELDSKGTIKIGSLERKNVEKECYEFLKAAGMREIQIADKGDGDDDKSLEQPGGLNGLNSTIDNNVNNEPTISVVENLQEVQEIKIEEPELNESGGLLQPLPSKRWIPLSRWRDHVRKCRVRVKRANFEKMMKEDEIPLARIKREKLGI